MGNIYRFSYDDREDALHSLAKYYSVDLSFLKIKLADIFRYIQDLKDSDSYEELSLNGMMLNNIRSILNPNLVENESAKIRISFYHRCVTDGSKEWFKEGLLNNVEGIECFIRKVEHLVPEIKSENLNLEAIKQKSKDKAFIEEKKDLDGICGFCRYDDAQSEKVSYGIPEIFDDFGLYHVVKEKLKLTLKNTIIKFYVDRDTNELNFILEEYWHLLWKLEDEIDSLGNGFNVGRGKTIPYENIEQIYFLD